MEQSATEAVFGLLPFRSLRPDDSHVGAPLAYRAFARPYRAVPDRLRDWRRRGRLILDDEPVLYAHEYTSSGITVRGLLGTLDLTVAARTLHPHEAIHANQVTELAGRMEEMGLNPSPILLVHRGPAGVRGLLDAVTEDEPDLVYADQSDQLHRIWRVGTPALVAALQERLAGTRAVIADGHHRFGAAQELARRHPGTDWDRTLVMLIDQSDTPLQLGAIHRTLERLTLPALAEAAGEHGWHLRREDSSHAALAGLGRAMVVYDGRSWATLRPAQPVPMLVQWLHDEVLPALREDDGGDIQVGHHHSAASALAEAQEHRPAVLVPAPGFDEVDAAARAGRLLPAKATSFQPKPQSGMLMRPVPDE